MARAAAAKPAEPTRQWGSTITFERARETKNKVVFLEDAEPVIVGTLYVLKAFDADMGKPEHIEVTINPA